MSPNMAECPRGCKITLSSRRTLSFKHVWVSSRGSQRRVCLSEVKGLGEAREGLGTAGAARGVRQGACGLVRTRAFLGMRRGTCAGSERRHEGHSPQPNPNRSLWAGPSQTPCHRDPVWQTFLPRQNQPEGDKLLFIHTLPCWWLHIHNRRISITRNGAVALKG